MQEYRVRASSDTPTTFGTTGDLQYGVGLESNEVVERKPHFRFPSEFCPLPVSARLPFSSDANGNAR